MKTSKRIIGGTIMAAVTALSLAACTYHERTVVERPVATTAPATVVVPEARSNAVIVPEGSSAVIVPNNN